MTYKEMITLILTILGSNFGVLLYLSSRIDKVIDKLDVINLTLGRHEEAINTLKKQAEPGAHIIPTQR